MPTQRQLERAERAQVREELASKRTTAEKIARLDLRLGVGIGAKKERARLQTLADEVK